jgi:hypothetical protein
MGAVGDYVGGDSGLAGAITNLAYYGDMIPIGHIMGT